MVKIENDIIFRFCDNCGKEWKVDPKVIQRASVIGEKMVRLIQEGEHFCNEKCNKEWKKK